jgi:hypothetical protein
MLNAEATEEVRHIQELLQHLGASKSKRKERLSKLAGTSKGQHPGQDGGDVTNQQDDILSQLEELEKLHRNRYESIVLARNQAIRCPVVHIRFDHAVI